MSKTRKYASGNKKAGNGNGNSVINNTEKASNDVRNNARNAAENDATTISNRSNVNTKN